MTKSDTFLRLAVKYGYWVDASGIPHSQRGVLRTLLKRRKNLSYHQFTIHSRVADGFTRQSRSKVIGVHRLQAYQKFGEKIFEAGLVVRHINGNSLDNSYDNIGIGTHSDNMLDIPKDKRIAKSIHASSKNRKFTDAQVQAIKDDSKIHGLSYNEIMVKWDIHSKGTLSYLVNNDYVTSRT